MIFSILFLLFVNFERAALGVGDRDALSFGFHYEGLLDSKRFASHGFGMGILTDYRWDDLFVVGLGSDFTTQSVPKDSDHLAGRVYNGKLYTNVGLTKFVLNGTLGFQIRSGPGAIFVRDNTNEGHNQKRPGLGVLASAALIWRPFFTSQYGYNLFVFTLRADYWRYYFTAPNFGKHSLVIGPMFGVEF
jgi:hypothetical protein